MQFIFKCLSPFFILLILAGCQKEKAAKKLPAEVFFRNPEKTAFQISPNGKYISFLQPYKNRLNIFVQSLDDHVVKQVTRETDYNVSNYFWVNNDELLYTKDRVPGQKESLLLVARNGDTVTDLLPDKRGKIQIINSRRASRKELMLGLLNKEDSTVFDVYRLNLKSRKLTLAQKNPGNITKWFANEKGKLLMAIASDGVNERLMFRTSENKPFRTLIINNFKTSINPVGFCRHNASCIYALSNQGRDKKALVEFNCLSGKEEREIFSHPHVDISDASYSMKKGNVESVTAETWKRERYYLDKSLKAIYDDLQRRLPNTEISLFDKDSLEERFIVKTFTDKNPGAFYLYIPASKKLSKLSDVNPSIPESEMCSMRPVAFKSRDGIMINGYLTLPKGLKPENLPVVVIPHGGPSIRNSWGFDSEVQFLANRGYAVFQLNFRGSVGYGKKFWILGFKQWGNKMQDDITDGVNWLIDRKIAAKDKIAIYGSGFGGFSALYGLCFHPELYACGASYSGLINLFTYMKDIPSYLKPFKQMYYERVGSPEKDADYFKSVSPVFHTDKIKAPVLIAQGAKDPRANLNEINQFVRELKSRNIPITYLLKEDEGYYFKKQENRIEFYKYLEKFLADNIKRK